MNKHSATVITVDGPSGSGKGVLSQKLASHLGWHLLDSGALYRVLALHAVRESIALDNEQALADAALDLDIRFEEKVGYSASIILAGQDVTSEARTESNGEKASVVAQYPKVRDALLERQRVFQQAPGLIADGRDMGTVVFPNAPLKIFLDASAKVRAQRRYLELQKRGLNVSLDDLLSEIEARDVRDRNRAVSPLRPADDATLLDTSEMSIEEVFDSVLLKIKEAELV